MKRTKGSKKRRIDSLAKTLDIFIRKNAIKLGNDAADDEKHTQTRKLLRQAYKGTLRAVDAIIKNAFTQPFFTAV